MEIRGFYRIDEFFGQTVLSKIEICGNFAQIVKYLLKIEILRQKLKRFW